MHMFNSYFISKKCVHGDIILCALTYTHSTMYTNTSFWEVTVK